MDLVFEGHRTHAGDFMIHRSPSYAKPASRDFSDEPPELPLWPASEFRYLRFSPDSKILWCGAGLPGAYAWSLEAKAPFATIGSEFFGALVSRMNLDSQGRLLFDSSAYDPNSGKKLEQTPWSDLEAAEGDLGVEYSRGQSPVVWNLRSKQQVAKLPAGHYGQFAISREGSRVSAVRDDGSVVLFEVATGNAAREMGEARSAAFTPDGRLVLARKDGSIEWGSGRWQVGPSSIQDIRLSQNGELAAIECDHEVAVYRAKSRTKILSVPKTGGVDVAFSVNDNLFAVLVDGEPRVYDLSTGRERGRLFGCLAGEQVKFDSASKLRVSSKGHAVIWDLNHCTVSPVNEQARSDVPTQIKASEHELKMLGPDGQLLGMVARENKSFRSDVRAISPVHRFLAEANDNYVDIYELPALKLRHKLGRQSAYSLAWSPDGSQLAVAAGWSSNLWDLDTGKLAGKLPSRFSVGVAYSPDGRWMAQGLTTDGSVTLWDLTANRAVATLASYGKEWIVLASDGRFDCSARAAPYHLKYDASKRCPGLLSQLLN